VTEGHGFGPTLIIFLVLIAARTAAAEPVTRLEEIDQLSHYSYAALLGTGYYKLDDRSALVARLPFSYQIREPVPEKPGLRLMLPFTIGFMDFDLKLDDVLETEKDDIATVSFMPGAEWEYLLQPNWKLRPAVHLGLGREFKYNEWSLLYGSTLKTRYMFNFNKPTLELGGEIILGGYTPAQQSAQFMSRIAIGVDTTYPLNWIIADHSTFISTHLIGYYYTNELEFERVNERPLNVRRELEVGLSFGGRPAWKFWGLSLERIGLAYRFSDVSDAIILVTEFPF
jgi:hypothetical protein